MARRRVPDEETPEEMIGRKYKDIVADMASRSEKVSWQRKMNNLNAAIQELEPIAEQIRELMAQRQPLYDKIATIRADMVDECVHPFEQLVYHDANSTIECKFCGSRFAYPGLAARDDTQV